MTVWREDPTTKKQVVVVGPDSECKSPPFVNPGTGEPLSGDDVIVSLVFRQRGVTPRVIVLAPRGRCGDITAPVSEDGGSRPPECLDDETRVQAIPNAKPGRLAIVFPAERLLKKSLRAEELFSGPTAIAVSAIDKRVPVELASKRCAEIAHGFDGFACIDELFTEVHERCGTAPRDVDPAMRNFATISTDNDFQKLCRNRKTKYPILHDCLETSDTLTLTVEDDGTARAEFYWNPILSPAIGGGLRKRELAGSTAIPRWDDQNVAHVRLPGAEFLASTDPWGGGSPHKPFFEPVEDSTRPNELNLVGHADKDRSILHFYPRLLVRKVCKDGQTVNEACDGIENDEPNKCVCEDRHANSCDCKKLGKDEMRYYQCDGGPFDGFPCTRPSHCWERDSSGNLIKNGSCTGQPTCWKIGGSATTQICNTDADCTAADHECGRPLFDFRSRRNTNNILVVDRVSMGGKRGACDEEDEPKDGDLCHGNPSECSSGFECTRFRLEARHEP